MRAASELYRHSLALLTDLYQLTMACAHWKAGTGDREAIFHAFFRKNPFGSGYTLACGLHAVIEMMESFRFDEGDVVYLAGLRGNDGERLFPGEFLEYLGNMKFTCDVDAVPEGTVVFPHEPLLRVRGPLVQAQILETAILNGLNFETLIATKAARICQAAAGDPVLEFGLRRAQGIDGGLSASRAAFVGGCDATSNVLAGKLFGIPVRGTHAHSWVMCFDGEQEAFETYADALPNNCVFLVDTYDTIEGVRRAADVGRRLRERGYELAGVRLDSGDLAALSIEARKILDGEGFPRAAIVASNDLDEHIITSLKSQGAKVGTWGVGTRLATAYDQPALGGVYKLSAIAGEDASWDYKVKLSEQAIKVSTPGMLQVRRFSSSSQTAADVIYDELNPPVDEWILADPSDSARHTRVSPKLTGRDLLVPVFRRGARFYDPPPLTEVRRHAGEELKALPGAVRRFVNPHQYPVGLEEGLQKLKDRLVAEARGTPEVGPMKIESVGRGEDR